MGLSDHTGPLQISGRLSFGLLLFGFALEGQGLLELIGDVEAVEVPWGSDHRLEGKIMDMHTWSEHFYSVLSTALHMSGQPAPGRS